ncbi:hypothetical protein B0H66DRAFT_609790 [Apodospora peruviana]|uniref:G domain-containing protein n=1 Tax=Apodospora peruviana TaxID=516989 RepID=A0AAE0MED2_9PEZI|nr:hypothetical protein B0H66DRAFT_609790 [Apodospora peruviana]
MGMTGSGKTSFISRLTGQQPHDTGVGHSLASSTVDTACYTAQYDEKRVIRLIDTPGFDDTSRSDADILATIADRLTTLYNARCRLLGIVCLHRITDVRLTGSAIKNFTILQKLCGPQNYDKIVLGTTMWSDAAWSKGGMDTAKVRENRLLEYWTDMFQGRSQMARHDTGDESAWKIISLLVDKSSTSSTVTISDYPLQIQRELVDYKIPLDETEAGRYVRRELLLAKEKLDRELAELQLVVENTAALRNKAASSARRGGGAVMSRKDGPSASGDSFVKQLEGWRQNISRLVLQVFSLHWSPSPRIRHSDKPLRIGSTATLKNFLFGSFSNNNNNNNNNNKLPGATPSSSTATDLAYGDEPAAGVD